MTGPRTRTRTTPQAARNVLQLLVLFLVFVVPSATATTCVNNVCNGVSVQLAGGECSAAFQVCDDNDSATTDVCDEMNGGICSRVVVENSSAACLTECEPDCDSKECGDDGCGGYCSQCPSGQGCSNYTCVSGVASGTCASPMALGNADETPIVDTNDRITIVTTGDTTLAIHIETPSCNTLTASAELIFAFIVPENKTYGYDFQLSGYDTVVQLMKEKCSSVGLPGGSDGDSSSAASLRANDDQSHILNCNDDGVPPGNFGSHMHGTIGPGTYFVMVDGYSTTDLGLFNLTTTFVADCIPLCDGNFCGNDSCGGTCGNCSNGQICSAADNRCYAENCQPQCESRSCGEDGCGGSCGTCQEGLRCLGFAFATENGSVPEASCQFFPECNHFDPICSSPSECSANQFCASDCQCYNSLDKLADLVILENDMLNETYLQDVNIPASSCALAEKCVGAPGLRRLLRFTNTVLNQGHADLNFPEPKDRPDLFEYGPCHGHYHFRDFAKFTLYAEDGLTVVKDGKKYGYCMEDSARKLDGANISCNQVYDCGFQGIQAGWSDKYDWFLDCSWLDITGVDAGTYVLEAFANPSRVFPEVSFDNNKAAIIVKIPEVSGAVETPIKLETAPFSSTTTTSTSASSCHWSCATVTVLAMIVAFSFAFEAVHYY